MAKKIDKNVNTYMEVFQKRGAVEQNFTEICEIVCC